VQPLGLAQPTVSHHLKVLTEAGLLARERRGTWMFYRLVPERAGFPRPADLRLPEKIDAIAAMADPATQADLRRLVRLFESALAGFVLEAQPRLFTTSSPAAQDRRLAAWARSRFALRRTGYRALKRLVYAAYYSSPETWPAVGYPGPPISPASGAVSAPASTVRHGQR
jgi:DNA-binding transcriptional ArsR family regulator